MSNDDIYLPLDRKFRMLRVKHILERETDENHEITMTRLLELLGDDNEKDRRTLYEDVRDLEYLGTRIKINKSKTPPHLYVEERFFSISELKLMIDAIASSKFLPQRESQKLINKLKTFCSRFEADELNRQTLLANRAKHIDNDFHNNVSILSQAINANRRVSFEYFRIDTRNKKRFDKYTHFTSPWLTLYQDDHYYLVAYDRNKTTHYRIDRIADITILDEPRQGEAEYEKLKKELPFRTQSSFNLFGGEKTIVTLRCPTFFYHVIVDKFGNNLNPRVDTKNDVCEVDVPVAVGDQFFGWIFGMHNRIGIVSPPSVRDKMRQMLISVSSHYDSDDKEDDKLLKTLVNRSTTTSTSGNC